jgi:hypothetical protein
MSVSNPETRTRRLSSTINSSAVQAIGILYPYSLLYRHPIHAYTQYSNQFGSAGPSAAFNLIGFKYTLLASTNGLKIHRIIPPAYSRANFPALSVLSLALDIVARHGVLTRERSRHE